MDNKIIRGWIVRILQRAYPFGMEMLTLQKQLSALGYNVLKKELAVQIAYLAEASYIEERDFGSEFKNELVNTTFKLTKEGMDLAEGTIADEGVSV